MSKKKVLFAMSSVEAVLPTCYFIVGNKDLSLFDAHLECAFVKCGVAA